MREFSPLEAFEQALRGWWLVVLLTILGGALGWAIHSFTAPLYEARATFTISLDFQQTGRLTQFEEDHAWDNVGALIRSTPVMDQVGKLANQNGIAIDPAELLKITSTERKEYVWILKVRYPNPVTAASLANLWADEANRQLVDAYSHAQKAEALRGYLDGLERCVGQRAALPTTQNLCTLATFQDLQAQLQTTGAALNEEKVASRGIISALSFDLSQKAEIPSTPIALGQNSLVLAGALLGFLISLWAVQAAVPARLVRTLRRA